MIGFKVLPASQRLRELAEAAAKEAANDPAGQNLEKIPLQAGVEAFRLPRSQIHRDIASQVTEEFKTPIKEWAGGNPVGWTAETIQLRSGVKSAAMSITKGKMIIITPIPESQAPQQREEKDNTEKNAGESKEKKDTERNTGESKEKKDTEGNNGENTGDSITEIIVHKTKESAVQSKVQWRLGEIYLLEQGMSIRVLKGQAVFNFVLFQRPEEEEEKELDKRQTRLDGPITR